MKKAWVQITTGRLHSTPNCSVARRTRYGLTQETITDEQLERAPKCAKCWKGEQR